MVDDDFLLAPVLAHYLFDTAGGWANAERFLARTTPRGRSYAQAVRANLELVLQRAAPFAAHREPHSLVRLKNGELVGEWRDSREGLGGGRAAYNVNAALVPAALRAAERLFASTLFGPGAAGGQAAADLARAWTAAPALFQVVIPRADAIARVETYARELGMDPAEAVAAIEGAVTFPAIALEAGGRPVEIQHSDDGFVMLFADPPAEVLCNATERILRPFPAGLRTPVGLVVANPAFAREAPLRQSFTAAHYHGTVIWSWQHAMLASGLRRQLARRDLPERARSALTNAEAVLWRVIRATRSMSTTELWSFAVRDGRIEAAPFGQGVGDADESNAAQLWSTVYLAVQPPGTVDQ
jgi:hypothetical protein